MSATTSKLGAHMLTDTFNGDNAKLIDSIQALLDLDAQGALVPHGVGGHARTMLAAAAVRLARQPAAIDKEAVCSTCNGNGMIGGPSYYAPDEGGEPCPDCSAPLANEASKPAPSVEQDERVEAWFYYEDDEFIRMYDSEEKAVAACEKFGGHWEPVFKHPTRQHDRFDPYRLKVAEECCERLMSACTDAGCPDGVRMDDWIRDTVARAASTSANVAQGAEAVEKCKCQRLGDWDGLHHQLCDKAPPAQTALTDANLLNHIRRDIRIELARAEAELNVEGIQAFRRVLAAIDAELAREAGSR